MRDPIVIFQPTITVDTNIYASGDSLFTTPVTVQCGSEALPYALMPPPIVVSNTAITGVDFDIFVYSASPSASTFTANSAHSIHANDLAKILGVFHLDLEVVDGSSSIHYASAQPLMVRSSTGLIYLSAIVRGTPTLGASDITLTVPMMRQG